MIGQAQGVFVCRRGRAVLDVPADVSRVHAWQDQQRFYILPSGIPPYRETRDYVARIMNRWRPAVAVAKPVSILSIEVPNP